MSHNFARGRNQQSHPRVQDFFSKSKTKTKTKTKCVTPAPPLYKCSTLFPRGHSKSHTFDFFSTNHLWWKQAGFRSNSHFLGLFLNFYTLIPIRIVCGTNVLEWQSLGRSFATDPRFGSRVINRADRCREDTIHPDMITILMRNDGSASGFGGRQETAQRACSLHKLCHHVHYPTHAT